MAPFSDDTMARISLVVFTLQNAMFVLLMRGSKLMNTHYNSSVAVLVTEALKLPLSVALLCFEKGGVGAACSQLHKDIVGAPVDTLKIAIPAVLYTVQNNALFIAMEHLEAAVFQVTYQLKTLTTAVLTVAMLGRSLGRHQWGALLLLMAGTALVQEPKKDGAKAGDAGASGFAIGVGATVVACVCSSLASVYLEKILTESKPSIWVRNAQLCIFTIPVAWSATRVVDDKFMHEDGNVSAAAAQFGPRNSPRAPRNSGGAIRPPRNSARNSGAILGPSPRVVQMLHGFNWVVWAAILTNAFGGMIVAVVMKFAGNILRNFAQACAIIVGGFGSWALFGFVITANFVGGVGLVILSIFIYGSKPEQLAQWRDAALDKLGGALGRKPASYSQVPTEEAAADAASPPDDEEAGALGPPPDAEPPKAPTPDAAKAV